MEKIDDGWWITYGSENFTWWLRHARMLAGVSGQKWVKMGMSGCEQVQVASRHKWA